MSINVNTISPPPSLPTQVATQCLTNQKQNVNKYAIIDDTGVLGFKVDVGAWGEIYLYNNATATTLTANTPVVISNTGFTLNALNAKNFDMPANGRLRYTGTTSSTFHVSASVNLLSGTNNQSTTINLLVNGVQQNNFKLAQTVSNALPQSGVIQGLITLNTNDYIELNLMNSQANPITVEDCSILALSMN